MRQSGSGAGGRGAGRAAESKGTRPQTSEGEVRRNRKEGPERGVERGSLGIGVGTGDRHWWRRGPSGSQSLVK